jgi:hypothetical protein
MVGGLAFKGRLMDKIPDAEYKVVKHQIAPPLDPFPIAPPLDPSPMFVN